MSKWNIKSVDRTHPVLQDWVRTRYSIDMALHRITKNGARRGKLSTLSQMINSGYNGLLAGVLHNMTQSREGRTVQWLVRINKEHPDSIPIYKLSKIAQQWLESKSMKRTKE
jgi:hypothetical protein